ncbi:glycosyltransferase family 2 protein [Chlorobium phaeovibrioides]|uniref:Glycosyltransferase family 2 protein n=1 Tax=Chlorobium phaeovibrioides TaxID=1094 RepID=A0A5M8I9T7_CHLPH|nr:glycosyltransferase family 2 protein [Chlorobium phaeovibrioides]KAA6232233.1 glycosyltransferase family 2 protein [Chlorobium phaeovibrioides]
MEKTAAGLPTVDIIIPHYLRRDMLERCLKALRDTGYPSMHIIVVDNGGSLPGLAPLIDDYPNASLFRLPENRGYAGGCNEGLKHATADFAVLLNDDTLPRPNWLHPLVEAALADPSVAALQPKILSTKRVAGPKRMFDYAGAAGGMLDRLGYPYCLGRTMTGAETDRGQYDEPRDIFWASGAAMFVRRSAVVEVGGFDEDFFMHMEEIDLAWRLQLAGYKVRSAPDSVVLHEGGASLGEGSPEKVFFNHRNNLLMLLKNRGGAALPGILLLRFFMELAAAAYYLTRYPGGLRKAGSVFRAMGEAMLLIPETLRKRRRVQSMRTVGEHAIFSRMPFFQLLRR